MLCNKADLRLLISNNLIPEALDSSPDYERPHKSCHYLSNSNFNVCCSATDIVVDDTTVVDTTVTKI